MVHNLIKQIMAFGIFLKYAKNSKMDQELTLLQAAAINWRRKLECRQTRFLLERERSTRQSRRRDQAARHWRRMEHVF